MRVGFDVSVVRHGLRSGTAVYTYNLARSLLELDDGPELVLYFGARSGPGAEPVLDDLASRGGRLVRGPAPWRWSPDAAWWLPIAPPIRRLVGNVDVFHAGELVLPPAGWVPTVITIHDLTPLFMPEHHIRLNRWLHSRRLRWAERHADRVVAVSEATRGDALRRSRIEEHRLDLVYEARGRPALPESARDGAVARIRRRYGLGDDDYVLAVGTIEPRKNHIRLLRAFESVADRFPDTRLVIAGGRGWRSRPIVRALTGSRAPGGVHAVGGVPADDLRALYAGATVFAFPSLYEGFGLPVLEAMAAGTAVLTSDRSSLPEVAGDAAMLVDPTSVESIARGLERLLDDAELRRDLERRGVERDRRFSWRRAAEGTLESYRRAVGRPEPAGGGSEVGDGESQPGDDGSRPGDGGSRPGDGGSQPGDGGSQPGDGGPDPRRGGSQSEGGAP